MIPIRLPSGTKTGTVMDGPEDWNRSSEKPTLEQAQPANGSRLLVSEFAGTKTSAFGTETEAGFCRGLGRTHHPGRGRDFDAEPEHASFHRWQRDIAHELLPLLNSLRGFGPLLTICKKGY